MSLAFDELGHRDAQLDLNSGTVIVNERTIDRTKLLRALVHEVAHAEQLVLTMGVAQAQDELTDGPGRAHELAQHFGLTGSSWLTVVSRKVNVASTEYRSGAAWLDEVLASRYADFRDALSAASANPSKGRAGIHNASADTYSSAWHAYSSTALEQAAHAAEVVWQHALQERDHADLRQSSRRLTARARDELGAGYRALRRSQDRRRWILTGLPQIARSMGTMADVILSEFSHRGEGAYGLVLRSAEAVMQGRDADAITDALLAQRWLPAGARVQWIEAAAALAARNPREGAAMLTVLHWIVDCNLPLRYAATE